jgi:hypothetical protein
MRPEAFILNADSPLADGLVFAGLGQHVFGKHYHDSTEQLGFAGNHGTLTNMDPATDWVFDSELGRWGLDFDGSGDNVNVPDVFNGVGDFTTCCIAQTTTTSSRQYIFASTNEVQLQIHNTLGVQAAVSGTTISGPAADTAMHFYSLRRRGVKCELFIDGESVAFNNDGSALSTAGADWRIGQLTNGSYSFNGVISDVLVHNRSLSLSEIQTLADRSDPMLGGLIQPPQRVLWPVSSGAAPATNAMPMAIHHYTMAGGL